MKKIPDESCSLSSQNSHGNCGEEAYDIVLFHELLSNPGTYYIGILYEKDDEAPQTRKKRSCFGQGRQKRSCVEFKDPPRPENITVKPVYDPRTDLNYTMSVLEEGCLFWDSREERWLSRGCRVSLLWKNNVFLFSPFCQFVSSPCFSLLWRHANKARVKWLVCMSFYKLTIISTNFARLRRICQE